MNSLFRRILITSAFLLMLAFSAGAADTPVSVVCDSKALTFTDAEPFIENGRTLVPLRTVFNALDAQVFWYEEDSSVVAVKGTNLIELSVNSSRAVKNGKEIELDVPAKIVNSRTVVPLRFVSEALGASVDFDDASKTVYINTKGNNTGEESEKTADEKFSALNGGEGIFDNKALLNGELSGGSVKNINGDTINIRVLKAFENPYNSQLRLVCKDVAFDKGDIMFASFKVRALSSQNETAKIGIVHEQAGESYKKSVSQEFELIPNGEWETLYLPYTIVIGMEKANSQFNVRVGYGSQEIEIKDFSLTRYNNLDFSDLPSVSTGYLGREDGAQWRKDAFDRIEKYRKSDFKVIVTDENGSPVPDAEVSVQMTNHEFDFGTAIKADYINSDSPAYDKYKKYLRLFFNSGVLENALKRPNWEANRQRGINALNRLNEWGFQNLRAHTMVWDRWDKLPSYFKDGYSTESPELMEEETLKHISDIASTVKGKVGEWDVANEVLQNHVMRDILGDETLVKWFKEAKKADPDAELYLNENTVLTINSANAKPFYDLVKKLKDMGAPIEAIGLQCHFNSSANPQDFVDLINMYSDLGLDIKITEFDFQCADKQLQADFTRDMLIAAYSCPQIKGFIMWGFADNVHWLENAPLFYKDFTLKPSGGEYIKTVFDTLWTDESGSTQADGTYFGRGFHGSYTVKITSKGKTYQREVKISDGTDNTFKFVIKDN